jgi:hypothetical protein
MVSEDGEGAMRVLSGVAVLWLVATTANLAPKPRITPFFSRLENGPAFMVECRNTTAQSIMSNAPFWDMGYRVDGKSPEPRGRIGPGLGGPVGAGEPWRGILSLRQAPPEDSPATALGAYVRATELEPIRAGRHTIAIRCGGVWSEDAQFYWEDGSQP